MVAEQPVSASKATTKSFRMPFYIKQMLRLQDIQKGVKGC
jgi:hypothetical protein